MKDIVKSGMKTEGFAKEDDAIITKEIGALECREQRQAPMEEAARLAKPMGRSADGNGGGSAGGR